MSETSEFQELRKVLVSVSKANIEKNKKPNFNYIDKIANSTTTATALYYIRETIRDYETLEEEKKIKVDGERLKRELTQLASINDVTELRKVLSLLSASALAEFEGKRRA